MSCMTTIEGKGQLSAHMIINERLLEAGTLLSPKMVILE